MIPPSNNYKSKTLLNESRNISSKIVLFLFAFVVFCSGLFFFRPNNIQATIHSITAIAQQGSPWRGWVLCELIQITVALCGILPASATAMGIGAAYGIVGGFLLSAPATLIGALISFGLSRTFLRGFIQRILRKNAKLDKLDKVLSAEGWKIACLFRLSPIMPFSVTSYALGMSTLSLRAYMIGTLASLPALLGYITLGALTAESFSSVANARISWVHAAILITGGLGTLALIWHLSRVISRILSRHTA
ncbi:MAG: VTT domain-containing protein [Acetobacter sp.]